jgi:hypothetical protein
MWNGGADLIISVHRFKINLEICYKVEENKLYLDLPVFSPLNLTPIS